MFLRRLVVFAFAAAWLPAAWCETFPSKPVRVIVTFPPGGTPDIYGRVMSAELQKILEAVGDRREPHRRAAAPSAPITPPRRLPTATPCSSRGRDHHHRTALYSKLPYDPVRDLAPIVNVTSGPFVLMANPAFPPNNVKELIAAGADAAGQGELRVLGRGRPAAPRDGIHPHPWRAAWT